MGWEVTSEPREGADRIYASWTGPGVAYEASLTSGEGVEKRTVGGAGPAHLGIGESIMGVFRWANDVTAPEAVLQWRENPASEFVIDSIRLGPDS